jgi:hypothetical protein
MLAVGLKLASVFKIGKSWLLSKRREGAIPDKETVSAYLFYELSKISIPTVNGKDVVGTEEREAFSNAMAGLLLNYLDAEDTTEETPHVSIS